tara:strand:+ start:255 stop:749 length:495 start_codon:yes stop_codon:yes gene_type:complete
MNLLFPEILAKVAKAKTKEKKVALLRQHNSDGLRMLLKSSFDPKIEWELPKGEVPYIANDAPEETEHLLLLHEAKKLFHYIKTGNPRLQQQRRETMFIQLLEALHHTEAKLLVAAKDKSLHKIYKGLSANVVKEAFNWDDNYMNKNQPPPPVRYPQLRGSASGA